MSMKTGDFPHRTTIPADRRTVTITPRYKYDMLIGSRSRCRPSVRGRSARSASAVRATFSRPPRRHGALRICRPAPGAPPVCSGRGPEVAGNRPPGHRRKPPGFRGRPRPAPGSGRDPAASGRCPFRRPGGSPRPARTCPGAAGGDGRHPDMVGEAPAALAAAAQAVEPPGRRETVIMGVVVSRSPARTARRGSARMSPRSVARQYVPFSPRGSTTCGRPPAVPPCRAGSPRSGLPGRFRHALPISPGRRRTRPSVCMPRTYSRSAHSTSAHSPSPGTGSARPSGRRGSRTGVPRQSGSSGSARPPGGSPNAVPMSATGSDASPCTRTGGRLGKRWLRTIRSRFAMRASADQPTILSRGPTWQPAAAKQMPPSLPCADDTIQYRIRPPGAAKRRHGRPVCRGCPGRSRGPAFRWCHANTRVCTARGQAMSGNDRHQRRPP